MTFNERVKIEIINQNYDQNQFEVIAAFFLYNNYLIFKIHENNKPFLEIKSYFKPVLNFLAEHFQKFYKINFELIIPENNKQIFRLIISDFENVAWLNEIELHCWKLSKNKNYYQAILIGIFLASGVVCDIENKSYHTEIRLTDSFIEKLLVKILKRIRTNINYKISHYQKQSKLYLKQAESISDFLKYLNAIEQMMYFEEQKILKDHLNQQQRLNNLDVANLSKVVQAAMDQIACIKKIQNHQKYLELDHNIQKFMQIRLENPELSLKDLSYLLTSKYQIQLTKSGLNHLVRKIKKIAATL
ncbi:DNA-binding protein WhiA [[Mycoplasma] cavipharyngis]|uniref:DNA-binding protein WhiA n=1 Tax=[Mycoplasma] cavipharyngis TaxID=92757 RepID=UPI003703F5AB